MLIYSDKELTEDKELSESQVPTPRKDSENDNGNPSSSRNFSNSNYSHTLEVMISDEEVLEKTPKRKSLISISKINATHLLSNQKLHAKAHYTRSEPFKVDHREPEPLRVRSKLNELLPKELAATLRAGGEVRLELEIKRMENIW